MLVKLLLLDTMGGKTYVTLPVVDKLPIVPEVILPPPPLPPV